MNTYTKIFATFAAGMLVVSATAAPSIRISGKKMSNGKWSYSVKTAATQNDNGGCQALTPTSFVNGQITINVYDPNSEAQIYQAETQIDSSYSAAVYDGTQIDATATCISLNGLNMDSFTFDDLPGADFGVATFVWATTQNADGSYTTAMNTESVYQNGNQRSYSEMGSFPSLTDIASLTGSNGYYDAFSNLALQTNSGFAFNGNVSVSASVDLSGLNSSSSSSPAKLK